MTNPLPPPDDVVTLGQLLEEAADLLRVVLQVAVEGEDDVRPGHPKPRPERASLAEVPTKAQAPHAVRVGGAQLSDLLPAVVFAPVVHEHDLER
jgi:hypothetical protein